MTANRNKDSELKLNECIMQEPQIFYSVFQFRLARRVHTVQAQNQIDLTRPLITLARPVILLTGWLVSTAEKQGNTKFPNWEIVKYLY